MHPYVDEVEKGLYRSTYNSSNMVQLFYFQQS